MRVHQARRLTGVALAAAALAITACGGEDNSDFIDASKKVTADISAIGQDIGETVTTAGEQTDAALQTSFSELADRAGESVTALDDLDAPEDDIQTTIDSLSTALKKGQTDLDNIATAAGASNADEARAATEALVADSPAISENNTKLKEQIAELEKEE
ncbi:MAG: hypothetical protein JHC84_14510 [Solirubrobacteraceae bacterium]|nr:hypothetical protein [Solirubrobacteraceae bacterium]